jgi:hypothetical protein
LRSSLHPGHDTPAVAERYWFWSAPATTTTVASPARAWLSALIASR